LLGLGILSCLAGYLLAHILLGNAITSALAPTGSAQTARDVLADIGLQLLCGIPLPIALGASAGLAPALLNRLLRVPVGIWYAIVPVLTFVSGFMGYVPWNLFLLIGSAF
jgi:hypothetical protein